MNLKTQISFKKIINIIGVAFFALLIFTNIKVALQDTETQGGDISLFGVEMTIFDATYATAGDCDPEWECNQHWCSYHYGNDWCALVPCGSYLIGCIHIEIYP